MKYGNAETFLLFKEGNQKAFRIVYKELAKSLLWFSMKVTFSKEDSEDIVANAFLKLYGKRGEFSGFDNVRWWLYTVVKNGSIDFIRENKKWRGIIHRLTDIENDTIEADADMEMLKSCLLQSLSQQLEKLPKQRKKVIVMSFIQQKDTSEIAKVLHLDPQTVLNHKTRGLAALKKLIPYNEYTIY
jgi:RNA polymerase sigma-70 factor (ECF subfamily)